MRASIGAMQSVCKQIKEEESIYNVEKKVVSVKEVFRLQNEDELKKAEKKYL
jgi:2-methylisocitrate lyase-like PEP mutase family enzyme